MRSRAEDRYSLDTQGLVVISGALSIFRGWQGTAVRCPFCKKDRDKVIDSRSSSDGAVIRRRRECLECERRYTTYEKIEEIPLRVKKKDGTHEPFDRMKILEGMLKACEKRPVPMDTLESITNRIEARVNEMMDREVASRFIGELVMDELRKLDQVAYVRFASVYREFKDVNEFLDELKAVSEKGHDGKA
jgi:transcriptional repressor NrdR